MGKIDIDLFPLLCSCFPRGGNVESFQIIFSEITLFYFRKIENFQEINHHPFLIYTHQPISFCQSHIIDIFIFFINSMASLQFKRGNEIIFLLSSFGQQQTIEIVSLALCLFVVTSSTLPPIYIMCVSKRNLSW
jgi:hypothetical protein